MVKGLVALVGRPNVGKSTLFNRIVGRRMAVVSNIAGTTRDRLYGSSDWNGIHFTVVDTGGIEVMEGWHTELLSEDSDRFMPMIRQQAAVAIQDADIIIQVVDGAAGITAADKEVAQILRQSKKTVLIAANKLESSKMVDQAYEFYELGLGEVFAVSALHGNGVADLLDRMVEEIPQIEEIEEEDDVKIALLGRPNVGKSTLVNRIIGEERAIVSPISGTTRDAIDTAIKFHGEDYTIIDTAGIRKRGKIDQGIEKYSVLRALKSLQRADVVLLLIDGEEGITLQDLHIAGMIQEESNAGIIVLVNKWDAVEKDAFTIYDYAETLRSELKFLPYVPFLFISALDGQRTHKLMPLVKEINEGRYHRMSTSELNKIMRYAIEKHPPPGKGSRLRFFYITQVGVAPPTFVCFVNHPDLIHFTYRRYMENQIREAFPFTGTPMKLIFRAQDEEKFNRT